jgi:hypothetical protein
MKKFEKAHMKPVVVYIAGPYRAPTFLMRDENIRRAGALAAKVWAAGHVALCPHMNSAHMDEHAPDDHWLDGTMELMRRCDAVLLVEGWQRSGGTRSEIEEANKRGMPIWDDLADLLCYFRRPGAERD